jgi:hypothetical protein
MIYSVVNCKAEGVRRDSVVLGCRVCNKSDCQSNTRLSYLTRDNIMSEAFLYVVRFEVFTAVVMKSIIFWDVTP